MTRASVRALLLALTLVPALAAPAAGQARWTLDDHPPPPEGAPFRVPLGAPGDLQFWAPNRGLLAVEGNSTVPRGLYSWDGASWRQLATVCGGPGDTTRIAWAGPREFWTITEPSLPRRGTGLALCRFRDGEVVGSFSTAEQSSDPYRRMNAAACLSADECWFGGVHTNDPTGERQGAFHLRWDGRDLTSTYHRQGRGVSDLEAHGGRLFETTVVGRQVDSCQEEQPELQVPEEAPRLLHRIVGRAFEPDGFRPRPVPDPDPADGRPAPVDATDLLALDSDGAQLWAVGGGTTSAPSACDDPEVRGDAYPRGPIAAVLRGDALEELTLDRAFAPGERFVDVAAVPGTSEAWVGVQRFLDRRSTSARAQVARVDQQGRVLEAVTLPQSGSGRGAIARVAFTSPTDGWAVTTLGWLFHLTDGSRPPRDDDPAFNRLIDFRPNEAAAQFVPDAPPADDSRLFAPPPLEVDQAPPPAQQETQVRRLPALLTRVRSRLRGRRRLVITFTLRRPARIGVVGRRGRRVVARFRTRAFRPGRRRITLRLDPRRYPTRVRFQIRETGAGAPRPGGDDTGAGAGDTVTTGGGDAGGGTPAGGGAPAGGGSAPAGPVQDETVTTGGGR